MTAHLFWRVALWIVVAVGVVGVVTLVNRALDHIINHWENGG